MIAQKIATRITDRIKTEASTEICATEGGMERLIYGICLEELYFINGIYHHYETLWSMIEHCKSVASCFPQPEWANDRKRAKG